MVSIKSKIPSYYKDEIRIAASVLLYMLICKFLFIYFHETVFFFGFVPIVFAGWLSGRRAGILTASIIIALSFLIIPSLEALQLIAFSITALGLGSLTGMVKNQVAQKQKKIDELYKEIISLKTQTGQHMLTETKLRKHRERYMALVDNINEVIFQIDTNKKWNFLNAAWTKLTDFPVNESLNTSFIDYLHHDEREHSNLLLAKLLNNEQTELRFITRFATKLNGFKWVEVNCKKKLGQQNTVIGILGTLADYTEIKLTEENLKSHAKFEKLIATISTTFINIPLRKIDQGIAAALKVIGRYFSVDRSYLFLASEDQQRYAKTHEWIETGVTHPIIKSLKKGSKYLRYFENKLQAFETVYFADMTQLPSEALPLKKIFERSHIESIVLLPLIFSNQVIGFLGFDTILKKKEFSKESLQLLKVIADVFANAYQNKKREEKIVTLNLELESRVAQRTSQLETANEELKKEIIERAKIESELVESEARYRTLFDSNPYPMWVYDQESLKFLTINDMAVRNYGYSREEFLNMTLKDIHPSTETPSAMEYLANTQPKVHSAGVLKHTKKDGTLIDAEVFSHAITFGEKSARLVLALDITERIIAEKQLHDSLAEKEILLKEIHHRVKNNLQIISSLLTLQADFIKDDASREYFTDSQNRVKSMAIIHEKLYQTRDFANIDIKDYVTNLTLSLFKAYNINAELITIEVNISNISLDVDTAIPCGLIINELVSNSLKYAFTDGRKGNMTIKLIPIENDMLKLIVSDNGVGFPKNLNFRETPSLGLTLVNILSKQLNGQIELINENGTTFIVTFLRATNSQN